LHNPLRKETKAKNLVKKGNETIYME